MNTFDCFMAGYHGRTSEEPPYASSINGMAYQAGKWCREYKVVAQEIKPSRGYKMIVNRTYVLDFKRDSYSPDVTRVH